jgi:four helix bundle suffix protein
MGSMRVMLAMMIIRRLEKDFLKDGGLRERMTHARLRYRNQPQPPQKSPSEQPSPPKGSQKPSKPHTS